MKNVKEIFLITYFLFGASYSFGEESTPLDTIEKSAKEKKFTGSPITLKLKDADVNEVMRLIGEASGFNVVVAPGVSGKVTVSLEEVPWDQALDVVMTTMNLAAERSESVLRVMPRDVLLKEKQAILETERMASQAAPRITRVFPISYANLTQLSTLLGNFLSNPQGGGSQSTPAGAGQGATTGGAQGGGMALSSIQIDENTQSLIVRDTVEAIERIRKMIALLDVQTPQIMIEAKVIIASDEFSRDLSGGLQLVSGKDSFIGAGTLAGSPVGSSGSGTDSGGTAGGGGGPSETPSLGSQIRVGIGGTLSLNAALNYRESESAVKVVSSPSLIVLNGKTAKVNQGTNIRIVNQAVVGGTPVINTQLFPVNTTLNVTPRVTNDGSVFMKLDLQRDIVENSNPAPRNINTEVVVDNGKTLVLGGILADEEIKRESGIPILRDIPLIGWLFGSDSKSKQKGELIFFVTPKIVNAKKTALGDGSALEPKSDKL